MHKETRDIVQVTGLTTEYMNNPLGIGTMQPRLSWKIDSTLHGKKQTAYRIIVSKHRDDGADLQWDSGKVASSNSILIEYQGNTLQSNVKYAWRVMVWDEQDQPAAWSEEHHWTMGLLHHDDHQARWITHPDDAVRIDPRFADAHARSGHLTDAQWISLPDALRQTATTDVYAGEMTYFQREFEIPGGSRISHAWLCFAGDSRPIAYMNGQRIATGYHFQYPTWGDVTDALRSGTNRIGFMLNSNASYDCGEPYAALAACLTVCCEDGQVLRYLTDAKWQCVPTSQPNWIEGPAADEAWVQASCQARFGEGAWEGPFHYPPAPFHPARNEVFYARRAWECSKPIRKAILYATALGVYRAYVNGQPVDDQVLAPGWTDYNQRVMVQSYDVTMAMQRGENVIGVVVGPGWYSGSVAMFGPYQYGTKPHAWVQLHVEFDNGDTEVLISDDQWQSSYGPIQYADLLMGEIHDARLNMPQWHKSMREQQEGDWRSAKVNDAHKLCGPFVPNMGPPTRVVATLPVVSMNAWKQDVTIVDFGQNIAGWVRMRVQGTRGTRIRLRFAEMLNEDGSVYITNLRSARAVDEYILSGEGEETFEPLMTFHGFRYVEVSGYPGTLLPEHVTACAVASDTPLAGNIETSDAMVNQLFSNIVWGQRGNFLSVPTDCPQRDERLGWTGDAQVFVRTATYNMHSAPFFDKWMQDVRDAQFESGAIANVAPTGGWLQGGVAAWADAVVIVPWTIWRMYGDVRVLEQNYDAMCRHLEYTKRIATDWICPAAGFGDWLSIAADTPKDVLSTAYFAYSAKLMAEIADTIGHPEDAARYREWFATIRQAFIRKFVADDGTILGGTQTGYVLALHMDLLPEAIRPLAARHLADDIVSRDVHLSTGFVGVSYLLPVLCETGYAQLAYQLLHQTTFPSWLYSIRHGATTIWERWNGWTKEHGFYSAVMNSFNHYSLGSIGEWMYRYMAGIELASDAVGFQRIHLRPVIGGDLTYVRASFESMHGTIRSHWQKVDGQVVYQISIPANTEATVVIPIEGDGNNVWACSDHTTLARELQGVEFIESQNQQTCFRVLSGTYTFVWTLDR